MNKYLSIMKKSPIFIGIGENELNGMLDCLSAVKLEYAKNDFVLRFGDSVNSIGMVLAGSVCIIKEDYWGNRNIIAKILPGQLFAETYACMPGATLGVSVIAEEETIVMFMDIKRILSTCTSSCEFHTRLIRNLLTVLAEKNLQMNDKLTHMAQRTTKEKILSFLSTESLRHGSSSFDIPFNRQQLADYLSVDRSALSNELCKMRDEGILDFNKNHFVLKQI